MFVKENTGFSRALAGKKGMNTKMSEKEKVLRLLERVSDEKLADVRAYLQELIERQSDDEKIDAAARTIMEKYRTAFEELAK